MKNKLLAYKYHVLAALLLFAIVFVLFLLRIYRANSLPVFADEAIYIRWAQVMRAEPTLRFLPLSDGKQPLFMWAIIPMLKLISDPLVAGRMVSILAGIGGVVGIYFLSLILFNSKKAALISSLAYGVSPFIVFFDRLALADSTLTFFGIWYLVFLTLTVTKMRLDCAFISGFFLGGAMLTKSPAIFFILLMPLSALLLNKQKVVTRYISVLALWFVIAAIGVSMYQILRLGPNFHMIAHRNLDYVLPLGHVFVNAKDPFIFHLDRSLEWIFLLGPFSIFALFSISFFAFLKPHFRKLVFVLSFYFLPVLINSEYAKVFTARYILFSLFPLFVVAGLGVLINGKFKIVWGLVLFIFVAHSLVLNYQLIVSPQSAPLPGSERSGYIEEWSAGWGIKEASKIIRTFQAENPDKKIVVGTEGYFGTLPDGLQIYLEKVPNVVVMGTGLDFEEVPKSLIESAKAGNKTYFAVNSSRLNKNFKKEELKLLYSYKKPDRTYGTHDYVVHGPFETFYLFEIQ